MKCPVCDQENSTMNCTQCGFDASRDYTLHPTFGPVGRVPSVSAKKNQWQSSQKKTVSSPNGPQFVDYLKMVTQAAKEDSEKQASQEHKLMSELQSAKDQISTLKREQRILTDSLIPENQWLKERILSLVNETKELNEALSEASKKAAALKHENDELKQNLGNLRNRNNYLGQIKNELKNENVELKSTLEAAHRKNAELEAALEAERNKGLISRLFNR